MHLVHGDGHYDDDKDYDDDYDDYDDDDADDGDDDDYVSGGVSSFPNGRTELEQ